jgi:hypothetical protein
MVYVVTAGYGYYPESGCEDWRGVYKTPEDAERHAFRLFGEHDWIKIIEIDTTTCDYREVWNSNQFKA